MTEDILTQNRANKLGVDYGLLNEDNSFSEPYFDSAEHMGILLAHIPSSTNVLIKVDITVLDD